MRLDGEVSNGNDEGEERESEMKTSQSYSTSNSVGVGFPQPHKLVVGYALTLKKKKSFLQPKLEGLARKKGILFVAIDLKRPLSEQGPFDVVLHKLSGKEWCEIIECIVVHLIMAYFQNYAIFSCWKWNMNSR